MRVVLGVGRDPEQVCAALLLEAQQAEGGEGGDDGAGEDDGGGMGGDDLPPGEEGPLQPPDDEAAGTAQHLSPTSGARLMPQYTGRSKDGDNPNILLQRASTANCCGPPCPVCCRFIGRPIVGGWAWQSGALTPVQARPAHRHHTL